MSLSTEPRAPRAAELAELLAACPWLVRVLGVVREAGLPDAWVGAGVLRDLVWGRRFGGGFEPRDVRDVDVAFFDPHNLTRSGDAAATELLRRHDPAIPWEATNQAAVHTWYESVFGAGPVDALRSIAEAVTTWPETATAVAVRLDAAGTLHVCAPLGLDDLLDGIWRRNPRRVTVELSRARLARHDPGRRWPKVRVLPP
ncbi:nucleotidyltransferase family protein [Micromonospora sp. CA-244673]|uniref:nucleotidyltransferase family protein n=1 Tax=Micromonospora sp. CA-244673 TaxID=3239958 RepID=UPI003D8CADE4